MGGAGSYVYAKGRVIGEGGLFGRQAWLANIFDMGRREQTFSEGRLGGVRKMYMDLQMS